MAFTIDIKRWADNIDATLEETNRAAIVQLNKDIILGTPVDKGTARGGWMASVGSPSGGSGSSDKSGSGTMSRANSVTSKAIGKIYYLTNNVVYIRKLEFGGYTSKAETEKTVKGFSKQAPHGMVRTAMAKLRAAIQFI